MEKPGAYVKIVLTYEDYLALPNDGKRYELIEGDIHVTPAPSTKHQRVVGNVFFALETLVRARKLGKVLMAPVDVVLGESDVVQPDVIYVSAERCQMIKAANVSGAPDLAVEVLSPTTERTDRRVKLRLYEKYGVAHYWILDPLANELEEHVLVDGAYRLMARLVGPADFRPQAFAAADLTIRLREIWAD